MDAHAHINAHAREFIDDLKQWLAIPSISADPRRHDDVRRSAEWLAEAGQSGAVYGEEGFSTLERIWARPTAEVNGMWGGHTGPGGKTIIPRAAHAKVSFRLVADQDPNDTLAAFGEYVRAATPAGRGAEVSAYLWEELAKVGSDLT